MWYRSMALRRMELPPRARRIPKGTGDYRSRVGTTSACAENTVPPPCGTASIGNYLRVRGEYLTIVSTSPPIRELPPRARRIPIIYCLCESEAGTTSACAENTPSAHKEHPYPGNYLRVRGEYC